MLERNLTYLAMVEFIKSEPPIAQLAADLNNTVDGNVLIDAVLIWGKPSPEAIKSYFKEDSPIGALGALAQRLHLFCVCEAEFKKQSLKQKKSDLTAEKQTKLLQCIAAEQAGAVSPVALNLTFQAAAAAAEVKQLSKDAIKRASFEKVGATFKFTVPLENPQAHFVYYMENKDACLALIDGTVRSSDRVLNRVKKGGKFSTVLLEQVFVPPHIVAKILADREDNGADLLLNAVEGPFSQPYFIGLICELRKSELKEKSAKAAKVKPEKLKEERDTEIAMVSARGAKLVAAAQRVLLARLGDQESLAAGATEDERTRVQQAVSQARIVKKAEEDRALVTVQSAEKKWANLIELSQAAHQKVEKAAKSAREVMEKAVRRKADLTSQAELRVQTDTIANAAKRMKPTTEPDCNTAAAKRTRTTEVDGTLPPPPNAMEETIEGRAALVARVALEEAAANLTATTAVVNEEAAPDLATTTAPTPVNAAPSSGEAAKPMDATPRHVPVQVVDVAGLF